VAIFGGIPTLSRSLRPYPSLGQAEADAVKRVVESGCLSGFYGSWGSQFLGGPVVKEFEAAWCARFGVRHAVSVNSATSGLFAAMGAIGLSPGEEVIVPPYTMSATVVAPLLYGGIPVFADIDPETFTLDVSAVEATITSRTRAIFAVNLFGQAARLAELRVLADKRGLFLIEDNAQGPLAEEYGRYAGTIGHIGVFSLNYHKHIHSGEGGLRHTRRSFGLATAAHPQPCRECCG
jgi:perosamine synthetase